MLQYVTNKNEVAYRGKDLKLWCIFGGTPLPTIKWTRIGQELPQDRIMHENYGENQSHCIEVAQGAIFMEQNVRFGLVLGRLAVQIKRLAGKVCYF